MTNLLLFPSAFALAIKAWLFWKSRHNLTMNHFPLVLVLLGVSMMNAAEFALLTLVDSSSSPLIVLKLYYVGAIASIAALVIYATQSEPPRWDTWTIVHGVLALILGTWVLASNDIVAGADHLIYSITRIKGEFYWVFQTYAIPTLLLAMVKLGMRSRQANTTLLRKRYQLVFWAVMPTVIAAIIVIALMQYGVAINATVLLSVTTSLFLIAIVWGETRDGVFGLLSVVPGTDEWKLRRKVNREVGDMATRLMVNEQAPLKESIRSIEHYLVHQAYAMAGNNLDEAAKQLGISVSSLRRKLKKIRRYSADGTTDQSLSGSR